jgi:hypothetical protein
MNPDGVSYLDMASDALMGGPLKLVNTYWSPGYPALISIGLLVIRPSPSQEFPLVHFVNFLIFGLALCAFTFFFRSWLEVREGSGATADQAEKWLVPVGFGMFLSFTVQFIGLSFVTPDLAVAGVVFLAAGLCCRLRVRGTWTRYGALGCSLGFGYYMKASMFPVALMLFAILFVWPPSPKTSRWKIMAAALAFGLTAAPLVALTSSRAGHLSIGEAGRLNYVWYANHRELAPFVGWKGRFGDLHAILSRPPRTVLVKPLTVEFATPLSGTYPLWNEPSYWWGREPIRFSLRQQMLALDENIRSYGAALLQMAPFVVGVIVMLALSVPRTTRVTAIHVPIWQFAWPVAVCAAYAFIHVETRFVGPFAVLFWLGIYGVLVFRVPSNTRMVILAPVLSMAMLGVTLLAVANAGTLRDRGVESRPDYQIVGEALREAGVGRGDYLAVVGNGFDLYFARYARARVVVQIPDAGEFWRLSSAELDAVSARLAAIGVKAIIARNRMDGAPRSGWRDVTSANSRFHILLLQR